MSPLAFVGVPGDLLAAEAVPKGEQLHYVLRRLFKHDQAVDVPGVEADTVHSVQHEFGKELESDEHDFIVLVERIERAFDYWGEVVRVEPVEEEVERF